MARTGLQKGIKKADTSQYPFLIFFIGRDDWIRTSDHLHPMQMRYQAALHPDIDIKNIYKTLLIKMQAFFYCNNDRICVDKFK